MAKSRILLVDDDGSLLDVLSLAFEDAGYEVVTARDGLAGLTAVGERRPDLMVCDVVMPGLDGLSLCRRLRDKGARLPILVLTSRDTEVDEALGLELGADDYVAKPFSTRVLLARVAALLRREASRAGADAEQPALVRAGVELLPDRLEVRFQGRPIEVTVTEFRLLEALVRRAGIVLSRARLLEIVRGDDVVVGDRIVDTYVRRLRRKLESVDASFGAIETVVGAGYRFRGD